MSISLSGATSRYPWARELDGEGDGDGDVPDGDAPGAAVPGPADGPALVAPASAAGDVGRVEAGVVRAGDGVGLMAPGDVLDAGVGTSPPRPRLEACGRCEPPAVRATVIPAVTASAATAAAAATTPGCRRTRRHHHGPDEPIALGKPAGPNTPARCATLIRCARPAGELSAHAVRTWLRRSGGSGTSGGSPP